MDAFSYLSVLFSIILGLAMTQILSGYRQLLLARARVSLCWPSLIWSVTLLMLATQSWWASFGLVRYHQWTFVVFATLLLQTVLLYMMAALVFPDVPANERVDLHAHYRREVTPFFLLLIAALAVSLAKDVLLSGRFPGAGNVAFHFGFGAIAVVALINRRDRLHLGIAIAVAALVLTYIGLLFARL